MSHAGERLTAYAAEILAAAGVPEADAALVADTLVQADMRGHQSHGLMRLSWYVRRLQSGAMRTLTEPRLVTDAGAIAVIDGQDGIGQVIAHRAMDEAVRRAAMHGMGVVAVRNSNHFGAAAYYTLQGPPKGCVTMLTSNASPAMAPWGGCKAVVGNNPWSVAAPAGKHAPLVLDVANTVVARGKIYLARQRGERIPLGWAIDADGRPTTDPVKALAGLVLPVGEHKGYSISLVMDVLSGVLTGSQFGKDVHGPYQAEKRSGCGHLAIALQIGRFLPLAEFNARMEALIGQIKAVPLAEGFSEVFYPGEMEARSAETTGRQGVSLPENTLADLRALGAEFGVTPLE